MFTFRNPKTFESIFGKQRSLVIEQGQKKVNHLHLCQEVVVRCSLRKTEIKTGLSQCFDYQATVLRFFKENIMKIMISSYPAEVTLGMYYHLNVLEFGISGRNQLKFQ